MRRIVYAALFVCLGHSCASAATLYAKIPGGNWSDASTWSTVGCNGGDSSGPPTSADDVLIESCAHTIVLDGTNLSARTVFIAPGATLSADSSLANIGLNLFLNTTGTIWSADPGATIDVGVADFFIPPSAGAVITFAGGNQTYGHVHIAGVFGEPGSVVITGANTFGTLSIAIISSEVNDLIVTFPAGETTTVFNLVIARVTTSRVVSFVSSVPGMETILTKSSGTINTDALQVTDNHAAGGATWCAYNASADGGGNTGWSFVACPAQPALSLIGVR